MQRLYVPLDAREITALLKMAKADSRRPHDKARQILRQELERTGYLRITLGSPNKKQKAAYEHGEP